MPEGVHCVGCLRYEISRIVATGELVPIGDLNKGNNESGLVINFDQTEAPTYVLRIRRVTVVSAKERNGTFHGGLPPNAVAPSRNDK
jgi:hypothetical protein